MRRATDWPALVAACSCRLEQTLLQTVVTGGVASGPSSHVQPAPTFQRVGGWSGASGSALAAVLWACRGRLIAHGSISSGVTSDGARASMCTRCGTSRCNRQPDDEQPHIAGRGPGTVGGPALYQRRPPCSSMFLRSLTTTVPGAAGTGAAHRAGDATATGGGRAQSSSIQPRGPSTAAPGTTPTNTAAAETSRPSSTRDSLRRVGGKPHDRQSSQRSQPRAVAERKPRDGSPRADAEAGHAEQRQRKPAGNPSSGSSPSSHRAATGQVMAGGPVAAAVGTKAAGVQGEAVPGGAMESHHEGLNAEQLAAVRDWSAPVISVSAGPGSGKTRTLVARVVEIVQVHKVQPRQVAVVTFTRKAANELGSRLSRALGPQAAEALVSGTFHSFSARLLRQHFQHIDRTSDPDSRLSWLRKDFRVLEEEERGHMLIGVLREAEAEAGGRQDRTRIKRFKELVSYVKNRTETTHGLGRQQLLDRLQELAPHHSALADMLAEHTAAHGPLLTEPPTMVEPPPLPALELPRRLRSVGGGGGGSELLLFLSCLSRYDSALKAGGCLDYDDLLGLAVALMQQPAARREAAKGIKHILVDEFQDTNLPQYTLVQLLRSAGAQLFVVGDANQSIYTWRGALPDFIRASAAAAAAAAAATAPDATPGLEALGDGAGAVYDGTAPPGDDEALAAAVTLGGNWGPGEAAVGATLDAGSAAAAAAAGPVARASTASGTVLPPLATTAAGGVPAAQNSSSSSSNSHEARPPLAASAGLAVSSLSLRRNHRSLPHIVAVAERVVNQGADLEAAGSSLARRTVLEAVRPPQPGAAVAVVTTEGARDEAAWVAAQVQRIMATAASQAQREGEAGEGELEADAAPVGGVGAAAASGAPALRLHDMAILYRVNRQARLLEEALQAAGVPYCLPKSTPFWAGEQVRDVAAFLRMAAAPLEASGALLAGLLTRPGRSIPAGSSVLSRLRRPAQLRIRPGALLFQDMVLTAPEQAASCAGASTPRLLLRFAGPGSQLPEMVVDPASPPPALAQAVADVMRLLVPPPEEQQDRWPAAACQARAESATVGGSSREGEGGSGGGPRWVPLPPSAIRRKLAFPDLGPADPPWMLVVDNEVLPAPLAPPPPMELCQALGITHGDAEYDGVVFLRDLVVLLNVAPHLGYPPEELVDAVVRATGYETWLELEHGDRKDLHEELGRLTELRQAVEQYGWDYRAAAAEHAAAACAAGGPGLDGAHARIVAVAESSSLPGLPEFSAYVAGMVEAAEGARRGAQSTMGSHAGKAEPMALPPPSPSSDSSSLPPDCVRLLTLHGSKGLEFPVVFLTGCEDGLLPHSSSRTNPIQRREEQRLLFVGITRAMDQLYLTWAATRAYNRNRLRGGGGGGGGGGPTRSGAPHRSGGGADARAVVVSEVAAATATAAERRAAASLRRMQHLSPFVASLLLELHAEGRVVEGAPDAGGCIAGWSQPAGQAHVDGKVSRNSGASATAAARVSVRDLDGSPAGHSATLQATPPPPLVVYHDATRGRKFPLSALIPEAATSAAKWR